VKDIWRTDEFIKWVKKLRDSRARYHIFKRIERLAEGNAGDSRFLGDIEDIDRARIIAENYILEE